MKKNKFLEEKKKEEEGNETFRNRVKYFFIMVKFKKFTSFILLFSLRLYSSVSRSVVLA